MKIIPWILLGAVGLAGCQTNNDTMPPPSTAFVPVYAQATQLHSIGFEAARPTVNAGKIYLYGSLLLQNELNEGIHLIDMRNPAAPAKLGFLKIPLCTEMAVSNGYLYTNNYDDLLVYNLQASGGPALVKRIEKVFPPANQEYPPLFGVSFECPDPSKGVVVRWEQKQNVAVRCRR
ncbi:MAG: hypothetical protein MUF62_01165 [Chitinophagaceae bacterium]|nr:hypothetical protein [Chitinophagaceae bacterium]